MNNVNPNNIYKPNVVEFEDVDSLYLQCVNYIEDQILGVEAQSGVARILLSGEESLLPIYKKLGHSSILNWNTLEIFQSEESISDNLENKKSSEKLEKNLGSEIISLCKEVNFIKSDISPEESLENYSEILDSLDGIWFDQVVLGLGSDGTVGGIFPEIEYLKQNNQSIIQTKNENDVFLALTPSSILNAKDIILVVIGEAKIQALSELLEGTSSAQDFPAKFLFTHPRVKIFFCPQNH